MEVTLEGRTYQVALASPIGTPCKAGSTEIGFIWRMNVNGQLADPQLVLSEGALHELFTKLLPHIRGKALVMDDLGLKHDDEISTRLTRILHEVTSAR